MKKHALLIGINEYPNYARLTGAAQDATDVAQVLQDLYGFSEDELTLLTCRRQGNFWPSRTNIRSHFKRIRDIKNFDLLLVGFWGHGSMFAPPSGEHELYLCAHDTREDDLDDTGIPLNFCLSFKICG